MTTLPSILLVDDDYTTNFLNTRLLQHFDPAVQVRTALNGQEALDMLRAHGQPPALGSPALLFLDLNMPVMDGFSFLEAYRPLPGAEQPALVVIVLTTSTNPGDLVRLQAFPVAGVLAKPLTKEKIAQVLAAHFPLSPAGH